MGQRGPGAAEARGLRASDQGLCAAPPTGFEPVPPP